MSSTAVLSTLDLNTPNNKLFLTGAPRLSAQRRDRRPFRPQQPPALTGPVYTPSSRFTFNPFEDETDEVSPYTHYYYYDPNTNSPALAFKQQPPCTITSPTHTSVNLNLNPSPLYPSAPSRSSSSRSPSPPSPSSPNSFPSFYPPSYPASMSLVENQSQSQSRVANRSPSPPSPTRRRAGAMSLGPVGGSTGNDYSRVRSYPTTSVSSPYAQPHPSSKGFSPLSVGPTPATPRLANRTLNQHQHQSSPYSHSYNSYQNNTTNVTVKKPMGRSYTTASRGAQQGQAVLVSSGRTNPPPAIERPGSAPPALLTTPTAHSTTTTAPSSPAPNTKPSANRPQPQTKSQSQSSIYTLLSRPLPASSRDTIAGIVASMLLSRGDTPSVGRPRRSSALGGMGGCGGNATAGYVKSGLSRVVFVE